MTQNITAVVFDLGKVLLDFNYDLVIQRVANNTNGAANQVRQLLIETSLLGDYESGRITSEVFHQQLTTTLNQQIPYPRFREQFADIFSPIPEMIQAQQHLASHNIPTYIFSNTNEIAITHIRERYPFFNHFTGYILSYEVGTMKPQPAIYQALENLANTPPQSLLYLDDRPENVEAALARGWKGIVHTNPASSLAALRHAGLLP